MIIGYGETGITHDFFCYNSAGQVWNGTAFEAWNDANLATYRVAATEVGTSGKYTGTEPANTDHYELRERGATATTSYVVWTDSISSGGGGDLTQLETDVTFIKGKVQAVGAVQVTGLMSAEGRLNPIIIGDDYKPVNQRTIDITFDEIPGWNIGGTPPITGKFGLEKVGDPTVNALVSGQPVTDNGDGTWTVSYAVDKAVTTGLTEGEYKWSAEVTNGTDEITVAFSRRSTEYVNLYKKYT